MKNNALLKYYQMMGSKPPKPTGYIQFEDPEVERICIANFSSDGIGVSYEDAEKVTEMQSLFVYSSAQTFRELKYFKNLKILNATFDSAFDIKIIDLPNSITDLKPLAFRLCKNLNININLPNLKSIADRSLAYTGITSISNLGYITYIDIESICENPSLKSVVLPNSLVEIKDKGFFNDKALTNVTFNENLKILGVRAFQYCSLDNTIIDLPNLETTNLHSFGYTNIQKVLSLGNITKLGQECFSHCGMLKSIVLPSTLIDLGYKTFDQCISLATIVSYAEKPPLYSETFINTPFTDGIYVPDTSVNAYKTANGWSTYADKIKPLSTYVEPTNN